MSTTLARPTGRRRDGVRIAAWTATVAASAVAWLGVALVALGPA